MIRKYYDQMKQGDKHKKGGFVLFFFSSHPEFGGRLVSGTERANRLPPQKKHEPTNNRPPTLKEKKKSRCVIHTRASRCHRSINRTKQWCAIHTTATRCHQQHTAQSIITHRALHPPATRTYSTRLQLTYSKALQLLWDYKSQNPSSTTARKSNRSSKHLTRLF